MIYDRNYLLLQNNCLYDSQILLFFFSILLFLFAGCSESHKGEIDLAYRLTQSDPDSALSILQNLQHNRLSKNEDARYSLVYTIAQDKSGLDVDNDSLLRTAYTYYNSRPDDSLYAKCEYYMGKYYMLNDSLELAMDCLQKSANAAEKQGDKYTLCLALEKYSKVIRQTDPQKAIEVAMHAENTYMRLADASLYNIIYNRLNVSEALLFADSITQAENKCREALNLAYALKDSNVISDVYQDLSTIVRHSKNFSLALRYSKASYSLCSFFDVSKSLNLATAYLDVDSLSLCRKLLNSIRTKNAKYKYIIFNIRHLVSIKEHQYVDAFNNADSAYYYLEQMYGKQLYSKQEYYNSLVKAKYEKHIAKGETRLLSWLIVVTFLLALIIIVFVLYSYKQYKSNAKNRLNAEKEKELQEERIHNEKLRHKEIQLSTMRNFILKRIDTAQKIQKLRGNKTDNVLLTEDDWEEIRVFVDGLEGDFITRLQFNFPNLNMADLRFMMLIRLKMPSKALAMIYGISEKSIKQKLFVYKTKVGINGEKTSLRAFIETF